MKLVVNINPTIMDLLNTLYEGIIEEGVREHSFDEMIERLLFSQMLLHFKQEARDMIVGGIAKNIMNTSTPAQADISFLGWLQAKIFLAALVDKIDAEMMDRMDKGKPLNFDIEIVQAGESKAKRKKPVSKKTKDEVVN